MSDTQRRDLTDPQTIEDFVSSVQTLERLRHLLVLTVVDIRAVGQVFGMAGKAISCELYFEAEALLVGSASHTTDPCGLQMPRRNFSMF